MSDSLTSADPNPAPKRAVWPRVLGWSVLGLIVVIALTVLVLPLVWPVTPLRGTVEPMTLRDKDSRFTVINGRIVHYKLWGSPKARRTVLLLHGFGASVFSWRDVAPLLAASGSDIKVVAIDRTGFGLSERPLPPDPWAWQKESPYSYEAQAEVAYALLDQLSVPRAAIVGHSQGAAVAATMAEMSPQRVTALVLVAPAINGSPLPSWLMPALRTPQGRRVGPSLVRGVAASFVDSGLKRALANPSDLTTAMAEGYRKPLRAKNWDVALWEMSIAPQPIAPEQDLRALDGIPTLVIVPAEDKMVPPEQQLATAAGIPGAKVVEIPGANHLYHEENAAAFAKAVSAFLATTPAR